MSPRLLSKLSRAAFFLALLVLTALVAPRAEAHSYGMPYVSCNGCHSGGSAPTVTLTADSTCLTTGQSTIIHVTVSNTNGSYAGFAVAVIGGSGSMSVGGPDSVNTAPNGSAITHTTPKLQTGGSSK